MTEDTLNQLSIALAFSAALQAQPSHSFGIDVVGRLRCGPARRILAGIIGLTARQDVPRVVEMHDLLQAGEVSIVTVGFHEGRVGPLVDIAQCWHPNSSTSTAEGWLRRCPLASRGVAASTPTLANLTEAGVIDLQVKR
jgi:hypothetical protein